MPLAPVLFRLAMLEFPLTSWVRPLVNLGIPLSYAADNIGVHVKQSLKERVWNGEYVDLALLTDKHIDGEEEGFRMVTDSTVGTFSESSTSSRSDTNTSTTRHLADLDQEAQRLLQRSLSSNTWATYETAINTLHTFRAAHNLDQYGLWGQATWRGLSSLSQGRGGHPVCGWPGEE
ncbi:uncharacterized protein LOC124274178 [Haliotis rubra]|uniref:uncharacterized protein LOC124274178 n=1 Tax=Haliotis rubra TaxID=36100 RepID=UPI001EE5016F|nr:uncharacterized protein LOC124274178 [Haliotis rubra]